MSFCVVPEGNVHCTDEMLRAFASFELPVPQVTAMYDHLRRCENCNQRYRATIEGLAGAAMPPRHMAASA